MSTTQSLNPVSAAKAKKWILVDADGVILGRLASFLALRLKGKHRANFTPHVDCGDNIVVINAEKVKVTGNKMTDSVFYWHTNHPGGVKEITPERTLRGKHPERLIIRAVERMMKKDSPLARRQMVNLKVYAGTTHPHEAQKPEPVDFAKLNRKNKRSA